MLKQFTASMLDGRKLSIFVQADKKTCILALAQNGAPQFKTRIEIHHEGHDRPRFDSIVEICQADLTPLEAADLVEVLLYGLGLIAGKDLPS